MLKSQTKIICTIGPSSNSLEKLEQLFNSGMSIARLNMSHGDHEYHLKNIRNIRKIEQKYKTKIFIAMDTKGPELRIKCNKSLLISKGDTVYIKCSGNVKDLHDHEVYVSIPNFEDININDNINLDDSKLFLTVIKVENLCLTTTALNDHKLENNKRIHLSSLTNKLSFVSEKDQQDLKFAVENSLDAIFISFVENKENLQKIKMFIDDKTIQLISKIESKKGIENIDEIIAESDGIMIARGDLMNDVGVSEMFSSQKRLLNFSNKIPVIMATEMLQSMVKSNTPFRAEISDIGNAISDGCSGIMLSAETASGDFPVESVNVMRIVSIDAEKYFNINSLLYKEWKGNENRNEMLKRGVYFNIK